MLIDITVQEEEYTIRPPDEDDQWSSGDYGLNIYGVTVGRTDRKYGWEVKGRPGDPAVILVEHYRDGGTFGSNEYAEVKGAFVDRTAAEAHAKTLKVDHGYFGHHIGFLYFDVILPRR